VDDYRRDLEEERVMKDQFMGRHPESPFVAESVGGFHGLHYFPIDEGYRVKARLERIASPTEAYLRTNRDGQATMRHVGDLVFTLEGRTLRLQVFHAGDGVGLSVFVPFRDGTSGTESYGPGRYLTLELNENDDYELDFNRAFNPYCAYTDAYECGFPPAENDLPVPVRAGEKVWSEERNPATPNSAVLELLHGPAPKKSATSPRATKAEPKAVRARPRSSAPKRSPQPARRSVKVAARKRPAARKATRRPAPARRPTRKAAPRRSR
jgi:hypothetical protein